MLPISYFNIKTYHNIKSDLKKGLRSSLQPKKPHKLNIFAIFFFLSKYIIQLIDFSSKKLIMSTT